MTVGAGGDGTSAGGRYPVFDGSTDFNLWRARLENELLRFHLLGYIVVEGYDGSQPFLYNNEEIPPKCAMVVDDDDTTEDEAPSVFIKNEPMRINDVASAHLTNSRKRAKRTQYMRPGRLDRLEVIRERAEAMSILQRYLHPEVERAILGKNIYDSWTTLCGIYENRSSCDFYMTHRMLHSMELGEKKDESARDFISRLEMTMEQYARITGIQLTDPFRSMILANALPATWEPLLNMWKAFKTYIPYNELVGNVCYEHNRKLLIQETEVASVQPLLEKQNAVPKETRAAMTSQETLLVVNTSVASTSQQSPRSPYTSATVAKVSSKSVQEESKHVQRDSRDENHEAKKKVGQDDKQSEKTNHHDKHESKRDERRGTKRDDRHDARDYHKRDDKTEDRRYEARDYDRKGYNRDYIANREEREKFNTCYYCFKYGHSFRTCWFLRVDIENDTFRDNKKRYSATVSKERTPFMVEKIVKYVEEVRQDRGDRSISEIARTPSRSYSQRANMRSKSSFREESTHSYAKSYQYERSKEQPVSTGLVDTSSLSYSELAAVRSKSSYREHSHVSEQEQHGGVHRHPLSQSNGYAPDFDRCRKRSRSVYGGDDETDEKARLRDPRSRSVFRSTELPTPRDTRSRSEFRN
uniref:Uncharacterized protein n=1 Tax=Globisporangium ultimum (strain ATCC 200006 / CBS 805.95 / DAOM BR144) TaxID=431595 RepID=K3WWK0_GLOUD